MEEGKKPPTTQIAKLKERVSELESQLSTQTRGLPENTGVPVIIQMGKKKKKHIKRLKKGKGKLMNKVYGAIHQVNHSIENEANDKMLVPVVLIYRKKSKKSNWLQIPFL